MFLCDTEASYTQTYVAYKKASSQFLFFLYRLWISFMIFVEYLLLERAIS